MQHYVKIERWDNAYKNTGNTVLVVEDDQFQLLQELENCGIIRIIEFELKEFAN